MDLFTRCPDCDTVFRVTTRHLQASGGQVRCGRCDSVFDAFASLTAKPPGVSQAHPAAAENQSNSPDEATAVAPSADPSTLSDTVPARKQDAAPPPAPTPAQTKRRRIINESETNLYEWEFKPAPTLRRTGLWLGLSLLLLVSGLIQAGYLFRTEIMVNLPQLRPLYQQACQWLSCEIGLPRLADQLNIVASDLQFVDPQRPNLVKLTAMVRNRARVPVEYPAFELTLTNAQQKVVARRVFLPQDYLQESAQTDDGLAGRQELAVSLYLDTGSLRAAGYRIYLFYPSRT